MFKKVWQPFFLEKSNEGNFNMQSLKIKLKGQKKAIANI